MKTNIHEFKGGLDAALRELSHDSDRVEEEGRKINAYKRLFEAAKEHLSEIEDLKEELERKQEEIDDLCEQLEQKDQEIADLRQQLLEARNLHLESEKQQLETEVKAKPTEIHNHFEPGCSAQVFNDKVNGRFTRKPIVKKDKNDKKRWKKIVRKVL
jgi:chromosome segregation ATPase